MNCEDIRDDMLDVLYGEAEEAATERVTTHHLACQDCRAEFEALQRVRSDLAAWPTPATTPLVSPRPRRSWDVSWLLPLAAGLILGFGLSGTELSWQDGRPLLRTPGARVAAVEARLQAQQQQHETELAALRSSIVAPRAVTAAATLDEEVVLSRVSALIAASEQRQADRLRAQFVEHGQRLDVQRRYDLARVQAGLNYLDRKTGHDVARTTELVGYVLQAVQQK